MPNETEPAAKPVVRARLTAFYLSRDRVLGLLEAERLPQNVLAALQGHDVQMSTAILSNVVGAYLLGAIASGAIKTLQQLAFENNLRQGVQFIYNGHFFGKGFSARNKTLALSLTEALDEPLAGRKLVIDFSKNGLVNETAFTRLSGSTRLFTFGYISALEDDIIQAIPYVVGDLVDGRSALALPFLQTLELRPEEIAQFAGIADDWMPSKVEFERMRMVPEHAVKELICGLLGDFTIPRDWGGEESDVFSANLSVEARRYTGAFLLKGPARFHTMIPTDLGKNGDQLYRLFNVPAQIYVVQHCHNIGAAVRKQAEAFALARTFLSPCRIAFIDGVATARLLRAHGQWPSAPSSKARSRKVV